MKRWIIVFPLFTAAVLIYFLTQNKITIASAAPDTDRIKSVFSRCERAIATRNLQEIMSCISKDYKDGNGFTYPVLQARIHEAFRSEEKYRVEGKLTSIRTENGTAEAIYVCKVSNNGNIIFNGRLEIELQKEKTRPYLIFSSSEWRIIRVNGYPSWMSD